MFQNQKWTNCFLIIAGAILIGLSFNSSALAQAQTCGGADPCKCGDSVIVSRIIRGDPVVAGFCPGDGLIMDTPNVTLTLKGNLFGSADPHTTRGPGIGIHITADNVTVQGGRVEGFQYGTFGTTNGSSILAVTNDHNAVSGVHITGNNNTFNGTAGTHVLGPNAGDGFVVNGDDNNFIETFTEKTVAGQVGLRVDGSGNFFRKNWTNQGEGGGILVTGEGNIDGGGNKGKNLLGQPKCEIDGIPCKK